VSRRVLAECSACIPGILTLDTFVIRSAPQHKSDSKKSSESKKGDDKKEDDDEQEDDDDEEEDGEFEGDDDEDDDEEEEEGDDDDEEDKESKSKSKSSTAGKRKRVSRLESQFVELARADHRSLVSRRPTRPNLVLRSPTSLHLPKSESLALQAQYDSEANFRPFITRN
jgi:hypothetical protein